MSDKWIKLTEIKVRHNLHTIAINLNHFIHKHYGHIELRFEMQDRNGLDFIGILHHFKIAKLKKEKMIGVSEGYEYLKHRDNYYLQINPGWFIILNFKSEGSGNYLLKINGFYLNRDKVRKGIGIVKENETNIAEGLLQNYTASNSKYVLLPLLNNYNGIISIDWFIDKYYIYGEKPIVCLSHGVHEIELYIFKDNGNVQYFHTYIFSH